MIPDLAIFPALETERLHLRKLNQDDAPEIFLLRSDVDHNRYIDRPLASSIEDARAFIDRLDVLVKNHESFIWAISLKGRRELAGTVLLWKLDKENNKAEIGYELLTAYQGKGIMAEAVGAILDFSFETLKLSKIEAWAHRDNERSAALLGKFNFKRDHQAEEHKPEDEADILIYSLLAENHL